MIPFFRRSKKKNSDQASGDETGGASSAEAAHGPSPASTTAAVDEESSATTAGKTSASQAAAPGDEESPDETAGKTPAPQGSRGLSGIEFGTIAGVLAFLAGGLGTIIAAIGDFGSDSGALAAARRNHVQLWLIGMDRWRRRRLRRASLSRNRWVDVDGESQAHAGGGRDDLPDHRRPCGFGRRSTWRGGDQCSETGAASNPG
jgi:hypothetical protein